MTIFKKEAHYQEKPKRNLKFFTLICHPPSIITFNFLFKRNFPSTRSHGFLTYKALSFASAFLLLIYNQPENDFQFPRVLELVYRVSRANFTNELRGKKILNKY